MLIFEALHLSSTSLPISYIFQQPFLHFLFFFIDPLPKKQIFRDIVAYLLNNKEWQFIIEERGNTEGITDFREVKILETN